MAKRAQSETVQLKVRLKEPDRAALERAAAERGVSMNTEIVDRLRRSFADHQKLADVFGSFENFTWMRSIASLIELHRAANRGDKVVGSWTSDILEMELLLLAVE